MKIKKLLKRKPILDLYYSFRYFIQSLKKRDINKEYKKLTILNDLKTIEQIEKNNKSFSRFGDGEFLWILQDENSPAFQDNSEELSKQLINVLKSNEKNLLVGIPANLQYKKNAIWLDKFFWRKFINEYGKKIIKMLDKNKEYGNANLTRFYMGYADKKNTEIRIKNLKRIWEKKDLLIVEGEKTKLGIGNDLFDNANTINRIICPSKNAFDKYEEIKQKTIENGKNRLILIALGPTATILAYDISKIGYQAIDIGHIDIEYEWYKRNAKEKIAIEGKAVNEANDDSIENTEIKDNRYEKQIITKIL